MGGYIGSGIGTVANAAERKQTYSITTSTTSLTGLAYTPTKVHVFHNGVRLVDGTDYTATNGTSITLTNAAQNGDEVVVISYPSFQTSDTVSAANGGTFAGNVAMSGTLGVTGKITSTAGITFGSDTAAVNVLSDYEEGTFSPNITDGTNNAAVDSNTGGHYTKIGNLVFVTGHINMTSKGSLSGDIKISGLPFSVKADSNFFTRGGGSVGRVDNLNRAADDQAIYIAVEPNVSTLDIYIDDDTNENTKLTASQIDATFRLYFSATYVT